MQERCSPVGHSEIVNWGGYHGWGFRQYQDKIDRFPYSSEVGVPTACLKSSVVFAQPEDLYHIKALADAHRQALGFVNRATLIKATANQEILYLPEGFLHFHHRRDNISTLYHLCVDPCHRKQSIGRRLLLAWEEHSRNCSVVALRLKCPIDLEANGFYYRMGFSRVGIEPGKQRSLVIWEKKLRPDAPKTPKFVPSLSAGGSEIERLRQLWNSGNDPRKPFAHVLYSPIACPASTTEYLRQEKDAGGVEKVWLDCGAYQVQQGKRTYDELLSFLDRFYQDNQWADGYVLPDIVPISTDSDEVVKHKVSVTLYHCQKFFDQMPTYIQERAIAPVHGRDVSQINRCIETYAKMGITRVGFGSWATSGRDGSVNMLTQSSLTLFEIVCHLAFEHGMKVHCFGIGGPNSLKRLREKRVIPHTLDSTTWWKAGGFGRIFFPNTSQIQITVRRGIETTKLGLEQLKISSKHRCEFCEDIELLRTSRKHRIMHNLTAWLDVLGR